MSHHIDTQSGGIEWGGGRREEDMGERRRDVKWWKNHTQVTVQIE